MRTARSIHRVTFNPLLSDYTSIFEITMIIFDLETTVDLTEYLETDTFQIVPCKGNLSLAMLN